MKKYIALLIGLVLGFGFVSCSNDDDEDENVNGEDKYLAEVLTVRYDWKDGKRSGEGYPYKLDMYDENGDYAGGAHFLSGHRTEIIRNVKGERIEERITDLNDSKSIITRYLMEYDYADSGAVVTMHEYNWNNKLVLTYIREFGNDQRLTKWTEHVDSIGNNSGVVRTYSYSGNTETIEITNLKNGSFVQKIVSEKDSHDNVTKTTITYAKGGISTAEYVNEYDSNGRLKKKTGPIYDGGTIYGYTEYTYNGDGTVSKEHCVNKMGAFSEEEYDLEYSYKYEMK